MLKLIAKFIKVMNSEAEPEQISLAFCLAMIAGFTPLYTLHNIIVFLLVLVLRANLSAFVLGWIAFSAVGYLFDPLFHRLGLALLQSESLKGLWENLYNLTFFRMEHFNNSMVMGSLIASLIAAFPVYYISNFIVRRYREHILAWVQKTKIMQAFKASRLYTFYQNVSGWGGGGS